MTRFVGGGSAQVWCSQQWRPSRLSYTMCPHRRRMSPQCLIFVKGGIDHAGIGKSPATCPSSVDCVFFCTFFSGASLRLSVKVWWAHQPERVKSGLFCPFLLFCACLCCLLVQDGFSCHVCDCSRHGAFLQSFEPVAWLQRLTGLCTNSTIGATGDAPIFMGIEGGEQVYLSGLVEVNVEVRN